MRVNYISDGEKIAIDGELGKYFIEYGVNFSDRTGERYHICTAGAFKMFFDALRTLKKHRPHARAVVTCKW